MSDQELGDPGAGGPATNRHRLDELPPPRERANAEGPDPSDAHGRGALIALGVAAIGSVAFVVGLRTALRHLPPERPPAAVDTARAHRFATPAPTQGDEYPRLR